MGLGHGCAAAVSPAVGGGPTRWVRFVPETSAAAADPEDSKINRRPLKLAMEMTEGSRICQASKRRHLGGGTLELGEAAVKLEIIGLCWAIIGLMNS